MNILHSPLVMFNLFAISLGLRDVFSEVYMVRSYSPEFILFIFSLVTVIVGYITRVLFSKDWYLFADFRAQPKENKALFIQLGLMTFISFIITVYGIKLIGAALFSVIEHGIMPLSTIFLGVFLLGEKFDRHHILGIFVCIFGVLMFLLATSQVDTDLRGTWFVGVCLSVICSYFTSLTSYYQKKLIMNGVELSLIIKYRFVPTVLVLFPLLLWGGEFQGVNLQRNLQGLMPLTVIGLFTFALPMVFLCFGFVRASLQRFSAYILLIPIYTFILSFIFLPQRDEFNSPYVLCGIVIVILGYVFLEFHNSRLKGERG